jgi:4-hydroxybenzoate polyprenyltransferase
MLPQEILLPPRRKRWLLLIKLIRWPNLVFIFLTQFAFQYCILKPAPGAVNGLSPLTFLLVTLSYVLIAAGGYIINDYFDLDIDKINKPDKVFIGQEISKQQALLAYFLFNLLALLSALSADIIHHTFAGTLSLVICMALLYWYSAALKKSFLLGNIIVAGVTAWSIPVLYFLQFQGYGKEAWLTGIYFSFAFVISFVREMVKDMEDAKGDEAHGCQTMPIVWGISKAKYFTFGWLTLLVIMIASSLVLLIGQKNWMGTAYVSFFLAIPVAFLLRGLVKAKHPDDYHKLSTGIKMVMALGITSMLLFLFNAA